MSKDVSCAHDWARVGPNMWRCTRCEVIAYHPPAASPPAESPLEVPSREEIEEGFPITIRGPEA